MRIISVSVAVEDIRMDDTIWGVNRKMYSTLGAPAPKA